MRSSMLVARILCTLFVFVSLSAAWPWPPYGESQEGPKGHGVVIKRQDGGNNDNANTEAETSEPTQKDETTAKETGKTEEETATGTQTSDPEETGTETGTKTGEATSSITSIDPRLPAGGIKMIEPPSISTTYYKITDTITFKWNYTSLSVTPTGINVVASCSLNNHEYTITANETVGPTGEVTWDTGAYQANATVPLLTETYTLLVYDVDRDPTDIAPAGHLGGSSNFMFGMYLPQSYTPLADYQCATCSAALSAIERQALGFGIAMFSITILSFAWFVNGLGIFS